MQAQACAAFLKRTKLKQIFFFIYCNVQKNHNIYHFGTVHLIRRRYFCVIAHALMASWISIYTPTNRPRKYTFVLPHRLSHSLLEHLPFDGVVLNEDVSESTLVWSYGGHFPSSIVYSVSRYQRRELTSRVGHSKDVGSSADNEVQGCELQQKFTSSSQR